MEEGKGLKERGTKAKIDLLLTQRIRSSSSSSSSVRAPFFDIGERRREEGEGGGKEDRDERLLPSRRTLRRL